MLDRVPDEDKEVGLVSRAGVWHHKIRQGAWVAPCRLNRCRVAVRLMGIRATTLQLPMPQQPQDRWREKIRRLGLYHTIHLPISSPSQSCNMHDEDDPKQPGERMWAGAPSCQGCVMGAVTPALRCSLHCHQPWAQEEETVRLRWNAEIRRYA